MKNVIIEQEVSQNAADIKYIPSGKKACWWTVTGVNTSQSQCRAAFSRSERRDFLISVLNEKTDRKELLANIELCQKLYNGLREGNSPGTFKKGYREKG